VTHQGMVNSHKWKLLPAGPAASGSTRSKRMTLHLQISVRMLLGVVHKRRPQKFGDF